MANEAVRLQAKFFTNKWLNEEYTRYSMSSLEVLKVFFNLHSVHSLIRTLIISVSNSEIRI